MSVYIGYWSAYEYWRVSDALPVPTPSRPSDLRRSYGDTDGELDAFGCRCVVIAQANDRVRTGGPCATWCRFSGWIFRPVARRASTSARERSFVEMATELSLVELVRYGCLVARCVQWRQAVSETHAFDRRALAQALHREVARLHRVEQGAAGAALRADSSASLWR